MPAPTDAPEPSMALGPDPEGAVIDDPAATPPALAPSGHPALAGREQEMAALADTVRRLVELTVTVNAPADTIAELTAALQSVEARMAECADPAHRRFVTPPPSGRPANMHDSMPFDVVMGRYHPLAPPITIEAEESRIVGRCHFSKTYEGAPGWVHGAVLAGAFDIVLTAANRLEEAAGPTVRLALRFRRPTLVGVESRFEAWIDHRTERRVYPKGHLLQGGKVTVEAEGEFATLDPARMQALRGG